MRSSTRTEAIDNGEKRVGAEFNLIIWEALKENQFQIPFPQREVNLLNK
jgi:small-conductance mechanosensitive channel